LSTASVLLERHGDAGRTVIPLELAVPAGPVIVEAVQRRNAHLSVTVQKRYEPLDEPLLCTYVDGFVGRAWTFLQEGRPSRLTVEAKGSWTVRLRSIEDAVPLGVTASATGCEILAYRGPAIDATIDYLEAFSDGGLDSIRVGLLPAVAIEPDALQWLLVSDKSVHRTVHLPGTCFLSVRTDGIWSIGLASAR
jgi:hypothetical protein